MKLLLLHDVKPLAIFPIFPAIFPCYISCKCIYKNVDLCVMKDFVAYSH